VAHEICPDCGAEKHILNKCRNCGYSHAGQLLERTNSKQENLDKRSKKRKTSAKLTPKKDVKPGKRKSRKSRGLILYSRRGSRVKEGGKCSKCKKQRQPLWKYLESSEGTVQICDYCKPALRERSFGKQRVDAWHRVVLGGHFGSNRRRH